MTEYNNDHLQGEHIEDVVTDAEFVEPDPAEPTIGEKIDAANGETNAEDIDKHDRPTPDQIGENLRKYANEAAYAAVGFAGLVGEKAKEFYEEQKRQYAETHPDVDRDPGAKDFLAQLREKIDKFVEDLTKGYKDMAERGRTKADGEVVVDEQPANPSDVENKDTNFPE